MTLLLSRGRALTDDFHQLQPTRAAEHRPRNAVSRTVVWPGRTPLASTVYAACWREVHVLTYLLSVLSPHLSLDLRALLSRAVRRRLRPRRLRTIERCTSPDFGLVGAWAGNVISH